MNNLFSEENKVPRSCLKLNRWQGLPHINNVKQYETVLSFKSALYIEFIQSGKQRKLVYLVYIIFDIFEV